MDMKKQDKSRQHKSTVQRVDKGLIWTMRCRHYDIQCVVITVVHCDLYHQSTIYINIRSCICVPSTCVFYWPFILNYVHKMTFVKGNNVSTNILNDGSIPNPSQNTHMGYQIIMWWNMFHTVFSKNCFSNCILLHIEIVQSKTNILIIKLALFCHSTQYMVRWPCQWLVTTTQMEQIQLPLNRQSFVAK